MRNKAFHEDDYTFAYLDKNDVPVLCNHARFMEWWNSKPRWQIKTDVLHGWEVMTTFDGMSIDPDGPPLFFEVSFNNFQKGSSGQLRFGTKETAIAFHDQVIQWIKGGKI